MRCKPGDLAVVTGDHGAHPETAGRLVDVLHVAAPDMTRLPDGAPCHRSAGAHAWVIKFHNPIRIRWSRGDWHMASYAVCPDSKLHPIRPGEGSDETLTWAGKPEGVTA